MYAIGHYFLICKTNAVAVPTPKVAAVALS